MTMNLTYFRIFQKYKCNALFDQQKNLQTFSFCEMFSFLSYHLLTWMHRIAVYNTKNKTLYHICLRLFTLIIKGIKKFIKNHAAASIHEKNLQLVYLINGKLVCCNSSLPVSPELKTLK